MQRFGLHFPVRGDAPHVQADPSYKGPTIQTNKGRRNPRITSLTLAAVCHGDRPNPAIEANALRWAELTACEGQRYVWSGRALQENFADLAGAVLHQCIRPLIGA
jgi:hypothetical protein